MARLDASVTRAIVRRCREAGFALAGVCEAEPSGYQEQYKQWIDGDRHGSMGYLARHVQERLDPRVFVPEARSLIVVADQYWSRNGEIEASEPGRGRIARYARGADYHKVMKKRLHAVGDWLGEQYGNGVFRTFVDTAPILEREHAVRAGLGWIGKHTLLIHPARGSYLFLGGIATSLELAVPGEQEVVQDHCGTCTRCIDACPTNAITAYSVDGSRCISALTIEERGEVQREFFGPIGEWIYGCDICQEVCPHNSARDEGVETGEVHEAYGPRRTGFDLLEVLGWSEADRREAFVGSAMKRATLGMMRRNAVIVAGNSLRVREDEGLRNAVERIAADAEEDAMVRDTARVVLEQFEG